MVKRKKRLEKQIKGLEKQSEKHIWKIENKEFRKDTTPDYWEKEIVRIGKRKKQREEILKKLRKKDGKNY